MKHTQQPNKSAKPTNPQLTIPKVAAKQPAPPSASEAPDFATTKQSQVIALLGSPTGATLRCPDAPTLRPGDVVTTGTWTDAFPLEPGQAWRAEFGDPLGPMEINLR